MPGKALGRRAKTNGVFLWKIKDLSIPFSPGAGKPGAVLFCQICIFIVMFLHSCMVSSLSMKPRYGGCDPLPEYSRECVLHICIMHEYKLPYRSLCKSPLPKPNSADARVTARGRVMARVLRVSCGAGPGPLWAAARARGQHLVGGRIGRRPRIEVAGNFVLDPQLAIGGRDSEVAAAASSGPRAGV